MVTALSLSVVLASGAGADPTSVEHNPTAAVFGEPASVTQREQAVPREEEAVDLWTRVGFQFTYNNVAIYYTTDGSNPSGAFGAPAGSTQVLTGGAVAFVRNEVVGPNTYDWWKATLPLGTRLYGQNIKYKLSAWQSLSPTEVFAGGGAGTVYSYTNKLAWPGAGSGSMTPGAGYPPYHIWKEEAVAGNNYINVMLDQNGSVYDVYYPSAGAVQGISTKNEGYFDGFKDQFPASLQPGQRGQMHMNHGVAGIRHGGVTYWLSNRNGTDYTGISQEWLPDSNVIHTTQTLSAGGANIAVEQFDFAPKAITFPNDNGGNPNRGLYIKRLILTNNSGSPRELNIYYYADYALNGGDNFDGTFTDAARGAMVAYDNTFRLAVGAGEYNPTTFSDYPKNVSVYLATAMKLCNAVGGATGAPATDFWSDTSADQGQGWIGLKVTLAAGQSREINIAYVGGFDNFAGAVATYGFQVQGPLDWMQSQNMSAMQTATDDYWADNWLQGGVRFNCPDAAFVETFNRGLLGTALHLDGKNGGIIAGMHNGAYPFVWPRDAVWAAITLARTGHLTEAREIFRYLRDICYRDVEGWGRKGFWKQKYTTDGYTIWGAPQVDETSCYPWGARYIYDVTGDLTFLSDHYDEVYEAAIASSTDSTVDSRLRFEEAVNLVYTMNLWEDSFDVHNYSNASVIRGLEDAAAIADVLDQNVCPGGPGMCGYHTDKANFLNRSNLIRGGLDARLAWNGENCDISQLGIVYPMYVYPADHARAALIADRINGVAGNNVGALQPLMNFIGGPMEWVGMLNRYWGDGYWNGGPWWLNTLWYGSYYALRNNHTAGKADIDNHKFRLDLMIAARGPMGFGAEQVAANGGLLYGGQTDFRLQTAWPNAWESMSFLVDAIMLFLEYIPDADGNTLRVKPKLPTAWSFMEYENLTLGSHRLDVRVEESPKRATHTFTNRTGAAVNFETIVRVPASSALIGVTANCADIAHSYNAGLGAVTVSGAMATGANAETAVRVYYGARGDFDFDNAVDADDLPVFVNLLLGYDTDCTKRPIGDMNADGEIDGDDVAAFVDALL